MTKEEAQFLSDYIDRRVSEAIDNHLKFMHETRDELNITKESPSSIEERMKGRIEHREKKRMPKMKVSGKGAFKMKKIIDKKGVR